MMIDFRKIQSANIDGLAFMNASRQDENDPDIENLRKNIERIQKYENFSDYGFTGGVYREEQSRF